MKFLLIAIAASVCCSSAAPPGRLEGFTLDDFLSGRFSAAGFNGTWISDNEIYYRSAEGGCNIYNVETDSVTVLVAAEVLQSLGGSSYQLSPDRNFLLYRTDVTPVWRHSSYARYSVLDVSSNEITPLQPTAASPQSLLRYAAWNKVGNGLIYVYENDIYYRPTATASSDTRLTSDGERDTIFNGIADWVYEEEVLGSSSAIWMANDGAHIAFITFNDTTVDNFEFSAYGAPSTLQDQYPQTVPIRYPKAGRKNPTVTLRIANLANGTVYPTALPVPEELANEDHYIYLVDWPRVDEVFVTWMNRKQNFACLSFCNATTFQCQVEQYVYEPNGWIDLDMQPYFTADGLKYVMVLPVDQGPVGNFKHLVVRNRINNSSKPLTQGEWELVDFLAWEEANNTAYILGTAVGQPSHRHVYKVTRESLDAICLTCDSVNADGFQCLSNSARFSPGLTYWVHGCNGPDVPLTVIKDTETGRQVSVLADNRELSNQLTQKALPVPFNLRVPVAGGYSAQVRLILPPSFDWGAETKYPLLVYVYGGPKSQQISERFSVNWGTHLASSRGVIYGLIDGRGSGYKGDRMLHEIYRRMGTVEIEDQIQVTKYLIANLPFIDADRTAIWGWSYGGFATAATLAKDAESVFKCGMSVAPVTNWIYYDSVYTERYMGLPTAEDNQLGYNNSDVCRLVENMRNKKFYLIHGTADDNVHYQQSMMLSKSLESADILFRQQSYPDENHSIGRLSRHLYHSLTNFLMADCFQLENEVWG